MLALWSAPKKTRNGLQSTINEKGYITLNAGLGEIFVQAPVEVRFTQDFTVMQIIRTAENGGVAFPQCQAQIHSRDREKAERAARLFSGCISGTDVGKQ